MRKMGLKEKNRKKARDDDDKKNDRERHKVFNRRIDPFQETRKEYFSCVCLSFFLQQSLGFYKIQV